MLLLADVQFGTVVGMLDWLSRRAKATLFVLCFIPADIVAALAVAGYWGHEQPTSLDAVLAAALLFTVVVVCEVLIAYLTFYLKVDKPTARMG